MKLQKSALSAESSMDTSRTPTSLGPLWLNTPSPGKARHRDGPGCMVGREPKCCRPLSRREQWLLSSWAGNPFLRRGKGTDAPCPSQAPADLWILPSPGRPSGAGSDLLSVSSHRETLLWGDGGPSNADDGLGEHPCLRAFLAALCEPYRSLRHRKNQ